MKQPVHCMEIRRKLFSNLGGLSAEFQPRIRISSLYSYLEVPQAYNHATVLKCIENRNILNFSPLDSENNDISVALTYIRNPNKWRFLFSPVKIVLGEHNRFVHLKKILARNHVSTKYLVFTRALSTSASDALGRMA